MPSLPSYGRASCGLEFWTFRGHFPQAGSVRAETRHRAPPRCRSKYASSSVRGTRQSEPTRAAGSSPRAINRYAIARHTPSCSATSSTDRTSGRESGTGLRCATLPFSRFCRAVGWEKTGALAALEAAPEPGSKGVANREGFAGTGGTVGDVAESPTPRRDTDRDGAGCSGIPEGTNSEAEGQWFESTSARLCNFSE